MIYYFNKFKIVFTLLLLLFNAQFLRTDKGKIS